MSTPEEYIRDTRRRTDLDDRAKIHLLTQYAEGVRSKKALRAVLREIWMLSAPWAQ